MIVIDKDLCVGCGKCVKDCPGDVLRMRDGIVKVQSECMECGHCVAICPVGAVSNPNLDSSEIIPFDKETFQLDSDVLLNAIKFRRSVRDYKNQPVEQETLEKIITAGRYAAKAKNNKEYKFVFVQQELATLKQMVWDHIAQLTAGNPLELPQELLPYKMFHRQWSRNPENDFLFRNAPVVVFISTEWNMDAGLAAQCMELMACSMGLGVLYNGFLQRAVDSNEEIVKWLGLEGSKIQGCFLLGYPNVSYERTVPKAEATVIFK